jgi:hypothetical protein
MHLSRKKKGQAQLRLPGILSATAITVALPKFSSLRHPRYYSDILTLAGVQPS